MSGFTAIASTVAETLLVLGKFLDGSMSILPGEIWSEVIPKFIRVVEVFRSTLHLACIPNQ